MVNVRAVLFGLASLGAFGGAYLHDLHTTDAELDAIRQAHAVECEAWSRPLPDDRPGASDARPAIDEILRQAHRIPNMPRAAVRTGAPLSPDEERTLTAAAQPIVAEVRAALHHDTLTRAPDVCGDADAPAFPAFRVHAVVALAGERELARGEREEGTETMVDALAFALELAKQGAPIAVWVSASLVNDSTRQLSRHWDDLSPWDRWRIASLSWPSHTDAALGARLLHTTEALQLDSPWWMPALVRDSLVLDSITSARPLFDVVRVAYADADPSLAADRCKERVTKIVAGKTADERLVLPDVACKQLGSIAKAERSLHALAARATCRGVCGLGALPD